MSKIVKVVKRVPKRSFASLENLLGSSGWLASKAPAAESGSVETGSRRTPALNYVAMQHYFRGRNQLDFSADSVLQSVWQFVKQEGVVAASLSKATSRGSGGVRRDAATPWSGTSQYPKLLFQDVNLQQYLSTVQPPRKSSTGLRPGRVIIHHFPQKTSVHVFSPDSVEADTWNRVASVLSSYTNSSVVLKAVRLQSVYQSASLVAQDICVQLEQRKQFRGITQNLFKRLKKVAYVEGIRVICSGRINGALIARTDRRGYGPLTLQSFSSQVDYAQAQAQLPYGILGIKLTES